MKRVALTIAWLLSATSLYLALCLLEFSWNLFDWKPALDYVAVGALCGIAVMMVAIWFLSVGSAGSFMRGWSLLLCLALVVLGVYLIGPEPLKPGLLGRDQASALWYRAARFFLLALPFVFWIAGRARTKRQPARPGKTISASDP